MMHLPRSVLIPLYFMLTSASSSAQQSIEVSGKLPIMQELRSDFEGQMAGYNRLWVSYHMWGNIWDRLMRNIASGNVSVYDNDDKLLSVHKLWDTEVYLDTLEETDVEGNVTTVPRIDIDSDMGLAKIGESFEVLQLKEKWTLQPNGQIQKKMIAFSPMGQRYRRFPKLKAGAVLKNDEPVFWLHCGKVARNHQDMVLENRFKLEEFHNGKDSMEIIRYIKQGLTTGVMKAYQPFGGEKLLTLADIDKKFNPGGYDTLTEYNEKWQPIDTLIRRHTNNIDMIQFKEIWSIDDKGNIEIKVQQFKLITNYFDSQGRYLGIMPLMIIKNKEED
jgi:hypothetical protein